MKSYPFGLSISDSKSLSFLIISDLHLNHKKLEKLKNWFCSFSQKIDYLLILGDFDNVSQTNPEIIKEICAKSESNISNILSFLEFVACPIVYLPGNHDAYSLFKRDEGINPFENKKLTQNSNNCHLANILITDDLQFVGVGGSTPAFKKTNPNPFYEGFPYQNDSEFSKELGNIKHFLSDAKQTILLTHTGPEFSSTSINLSDDVNDPIYFGSLALFKLISDKSNNILINLHGHIHDGVGKSRINRVDVVNPGSLSNGDFCILELARNFVDSKWIVKSTNFINLDAFN